MEAAVNWTASRTATAIALALLLVLTWVLAKVKRTVNVAQNGVGEYISDATAVEVQQLNAAYNLAIAGAAKQTGAALVDIASTFQNAEAARAAGQPVPVDAQGDTVTLQYGGGFFSLDGLHPSNTGYAVIANGFIQAFDQAYGLQIPPVDVHAVFATDPYAPNNFPAIHAARRAAQ